MKKVSFSVPYAAASISAFFLFFLNFNALFNYGTGYDGRILIVNILFFLSWTVVYTIGKKSKFPLYGIIISCILIISIISFFCVNIFDKNHFKATLDVAAAISSGKISQDMLYHSTIAESIYNYFRPSILANSIDVIKYHHFSHIIIAVISKISQVPPFFVYSYIYPQISITFFMYLYFRLIVAIGNHFSCSQLISTLTGSILLLLQITLQDPYLVMISSQSFFISILFCLLYFNIVEKFNLYSISLIRNSSFIFNIITPIFIFIISITKVSTGLIFLAMASWFYLRISKPILEKMCALFLYLLSYILAIILCINIQVGGFEVKIYNFNYSIVHLNIILPCLGVTAVVIGLRRFFSKKSIKYLFSKNQIVLEECLLIGLMLCIVLSLLLVRPDILYYFSVTFSFFGILVCFIILAKFCLHNLKYYLIKFKFFSAAFFLILLCILLPQLGNNFTNLSTLFFTLKYQRSVQADTIKTPEVSSIKKYFSRSRFFESKLYRIIWTIRKISKGNKNQYGIYISNNNSLKLLRPLAHIFFYQGLTGIVRYAPLYKTDKGIYSSSGNLVTADLAFPYYGIDKIDIPPSVNLDYALCKAKADGKKFLFYIDHDNLYLINLETNTSELVKLSSP